LASYLNPFFIIYSISLIFFDEKESKMHETLSISESQIMTIIIFLSSYIPLGFANDQILK